MYCHVTAVGEAPDVRVFIVTIVGAARAIALGAALMLAFTGLGGGLMKSSDSQAEIKRMLIIRMLIKVRVFVCREWAGGTVSKNPPKKGGA